MAELLRDPAEPHRRRAARDQPDGLRAPAQRARDSDERCLSRRLFRARRAGEGLHVLAEAYQQLPPTRSGGAPVRLEAAGYLARAHDGYLDDVTTRPRRRPASPASSPIAAPSIATASSRSCSRSTCCRCRRPTTSRRACSCSKRWRAACRSCSRGAARSPRSSRRPAAACWSRRTIRRRWPTGCTRCGRTARWPRSLGERGFDGVREHYSIARSADRLLDVYESLVIRAGRGGRRSVPLRARVGRPR